MDKTFIVYYLSHFLIFGSNAKVTIRKIETKQKRNSLDTFSIKEKISTIDDIETTIEIEEPTTTEEESTFTELTIEEPSTIEEITIEEITTEETTTEPTSTEEYITTTDDVITTTVTYCEPSEVTVCLSVMAESETLIASCTTTTTNSCCIDIPEDISTVLQRLIELIIKYYIIHLFLHF